MATLRHYVSGGFYILRGYPINNSRSSEEMFFTTIKVLPRAERFFELTSYKDGTTLSKEVFYALLLDGDLDSPSIAKRQPTIHDIPAETIYLAEGLAESDSTISLLRDKLFSECRYLVDFYQTILKNLPTFASPDTAALLCLARHARQAAYDKDKMRS